MKRVARDASILARRVVVLDVLKSRTSSKQTEGVTVGCRGGLLVVQIVGGRDEPENHQPDGAPRVTLGYFLLTQAQLS
jgi:hypothetical protein